jgi:hypothetical protein
VTRRGGILSKQAAAPAFQKQMYFDPRESDFRALPGKHLTGLNFKGFRYTDG